MTSLTLTPTLDNFIFMDEIIDKKYEVLSLFQEFLAYEALWELPESSYKNIFQTLKNSPFASHVIKNFDVDEYRRKLLPKINNLKSFGIRILGDGEFPSKLNDAKYPLRIFYYQGNWQLTYLPSIAVVGTRNPSEEGKKITENLVKRLVNDNFVIVSGLAKGVDTVAHKTAIDNNGFTIAVIGTPLNHYYPPENRILQDIIAEDFLLISQVPFLRYEKQDYRKNRFFFPERNITMSAISDATIIVEAGETSGTLIQAKAALQQGRKLFILNNNFSNPSLTWPRKFEKEGAIRISSYNELKRYLADITEKN